MYFAQVPIGPTTYAVEGTPAGKTQVADASADDVEVEEVNESEDKVEDISVELDIKAVVELEDVDNEPEIDNEELAETELLERSLKELPTFDEDETLVELDDAVRLVTDEVLKELDDAVRLVTDEALVELDEAVRLVTDELGVTTFAAAIAFKTVESIHEVLVVE